MNNLSDVPIEILVNELERRGLKRIGLAHLDALLDIGQMNSNTPIVIPANDKSITIIFHSPTDLFLKIQYLEDNVVRESQYSIKPLPVLRNVLEILKQ